MSRFRKLLLLGSLVFVLGTFAAPGVAAQNTWEAFWEGMKTSLVALGEQPTQVYFDTLYHVDLPNRDRVLQSLVAEANALTDMQVSYPIFIFEGARAAYQRVVTGMFTQPYVSGNTTLPPTNAPVRYVTQGIMDVSGAGRIYADYAVTDGFAKFQEFGAIPLAPGQEHGHIGLEPYAGETEDSAFAPGTSLFTHYARANRVQPRQQEVPKTADWFLKQVMAEMDFAEELSEVGIDVSDPDFDVNLVLVFGAPYLPNFSQAPDVVLNERVTQDNWWTGYFTLNTQPGTDITLPGVAQPLYAADPLVIPVVATFHIDRRGQLEEIINADNLTVPRQLNADLANLPLAPIDSPAEPTVAESSGGETASAEPASSPGQDLAQWYRDHMGQDPPITPANAGDLNIIGTFTPDQVDALARAAITPDLSENAIWTTQTAQTGIFLQNGGNAVFDGTLVAAYRPGSGIFVVDTLTNQPLSSFGGDLTDAPTLHFDPVDPIVYAGTPFQVRAFNYETGEEVVFEALRGASDYVSFTNDDGFLTAVTAGNDGKMTIVTFTEGIEEPVIDIIDTGAGSDLRRVLVSGWWVVALDGSDQVIGIWNTVLGEQVPIIIGDATISPSTAVNFDIPGLLALGTSDGQIHLFDVENGNQVNQLNVGTEPIIHISVSPDTTLMGAFSADNTLTIFRAGETGEAAAEQTSGEAISELSTEESAAICPVKPTTNANIRSRPDARSEPVGTAQTGVGEFADGVTQAADGYKWYRLQRGGWVRGDLVVPGVGCENLPTVSGSQ